MSNVIEKVLEEGTVYISDPLKLTHEEENLEMDFIDPSGDKKSPENKRSAGDKLAKWPERHVVFEIDYSGLSVKDVLHHSFTQTAAIDKLRQRFRTMESLDKALEMREKWETNDAGHPVWKCHINELIPKRTRSKRKQKSASELIENMDDIAAVEALLEQIKAKQASLKK
jgi:hypothetical protein